MATRFIGSLARRGAQARSRPFALPLSWASRTDDDALGLVTHTTVGGMNAFEGIPFEAMDFYEDLEVDNSRQWWAAHRDRYDTAVRAPMEALGGALEDEFGAVKVFRPNRDVRFAQDKSPYKTHQGVVVSTASRMGWYVQISAEGLMTAAGWYAASPGQVARYRTGRGIRRRRRPAEDQTAGGGAGPPVPRASAAPEPDRRATVRCP